MVRVLSARRLATTGLVLLAAAGALAWLLRAGAPPARPLPDFVLPRVDDPHAVLGSEDLRGAPALLNVWASWCAGCREEHGLWMDLARDGDVRLYGLNYRDRRVDARRWLDFYGDPYRASAFDERGALREDLDIGGLPMTLLIDAEGRIRLRYVGPVTEPVLHGGILPLLRALQGPDAEAPPDP